jgi:hypothetical protein
MKFAFLEGFLQKGKSLISRALETNTRQCPDCGFVLDGDECPLCAGRWEAWEMRFSPLPLPRIREQVSTWLGQLPAPSMLEIRATPEGLRLRLFSQPGKALGVVDAWASMTHQQTRWEAIPYQPPSGAFHVLHTPQNLPGLALTTGDPFLALGGLLLGQARETQQEDVEQQVVALHLWILGKESQLQERLRALAAYSYGTESGVGEHTPNPWGWRLAWWRSLLIGGGLIAALSGGVLAAGWLPIPSAVGLIGGGLLSLVGALGIVDWIQWRSIPQEVLTLRTEGVLLKVAFTLQVPHPEAIQLFSGSSAWQPLPTEWPGVQAAGLPISASEISGLICPPETGEGSGLFDRQVVQDVPAPPASRPLLEAPFKIGRSKATGEPIGIDPDGHGLATGGSRSGKTSFAYAVLKQLIQQGKDAPGIFLVDPHVSLADAFLQAIDDLPPPLREEGIRRLRIITPDQPEVVPLNLLTVPEFTWAGNAIVQIGRRIWEDYWGPRMQAALLGLFRLAHTWNQHNPNAPLGLLHTVFAAFNTDWRHDAMAYLKPVDRIGALALDALLGQMGDEYGRWSQGWVTEVVSPVLSKVMALELSPWLFAALHQNRFVDLEKWVKEKCWIVLRLPSGEMGREGARLTAGVIYNVFDAAFRKAALYPPPIPFYFVIDEAQEIGTGMRLEAMLSEGAKFGARMFVLAQSLSMMRQIEGFEPVVDSLLANTSTQAFFSPDPQDADLIRATLSSTVRYGDMTLDLPSLHHWLRARIGGVWQPPTLSVVEPLARTDPVRVQAIIREVIAAHPEDYVSSTGWQEQTALTLQAMIPEAQRGLLDELIPKRSDYGDAAKAATQKTALSPAELQKKQRLGF